MTPLDSTSPDLTALLMGLTVASDSGRGPSDPGAASDQNFKLALSQFGIDTDVTEVPAGLGPKGSATTPHGPDPLSNSLHISTPPGDSKTSSMVEPSSLFMETVNRDAASGISGSIPESGDVKRPVGARLGLPAKRNEASRFSGFEVSTSRGMRSSSERAPLKLDSSPDASIVLPEEFQFEGEEASRSKPRELVESLDPLIAGALPILNVNCSPEWLNVAPPPLVDRGQDSTVSHDSSEGGPAPVDTAAPSSVHLRSGEGRAASSAPLPRVEDMRRGRDRRETTADRPEAGPTPFDSPALDPGIFGDGTGVSESGASRPAAGTRLFGEEWTFTATESLRQETGVAKSRLSRIQSATAGSADERAVAAEPILEEKRVLHQSSVAEEEVVPEVSISTPFNAADSSIVRVKSGNTVHEPQLQRSSPVAEQQPSISVDSPHHSAKFGSAGVADRWMPAEPIISRLPRTLDRGEETEEGVGVTERMERGAGEPTKKAKEEAPPVPPAVPRVASTRQLISNVEENSPTLPHVDTPRLGSQGADLEHSSSQTISFSDGLQKAPDTIRTASQLPEAATQDGLKAFGGNLTAKSVSIPPEGTSSAISELSGGLEHEPELVTHATHPRRIPVEAPESGSTWNKVGSGFGKQEFKGDAVPLEYRNLSKQERIIVEGRLASTIEARVGWESVSTVRESRIAGPSVDWIQPGLGYNALPAGQGSKADGETIEKAKPVPGLSTRLEKTSEGVSISAEIGLKQDQLIPAVATGGKGEPEFVPSGSSPRPPAARLDARPGVNMLPLERPATSPQETSHEPTAEQGARLGQLNSQDLSVAVGSEPTQEDSEPVRQDSGVFSMKASSRPNGTGTLSRDRVDVQSIDSNNPSHTKLRSSVEASSAHNTVHQAESREMVQMAERKPRDPEGVQRPSVTNLSSERMMQGGGRTNAPVREVELRPDRRGGLETGRPLGVEIAVEDDRLPAGWVSNEGRVVLPDRAASTGAATAFSVPAIPPASRQELHSSETKGFDNGSRNIQPVPVVAESGRNLGFGAGTVSSGVSGGIRTPELRLSESVHRVANFAHSGPLENESEVSNQDESIQTSGVPPVLATSEPRAESDGGSRRDSTERESQSNTPYGPDGTSRALEGASMKFGPQSNQIAGGGEHILPVVESPANGMHPVLPMGHDNRMKPSDSENLALQAGVAMTQAVNSQHLVEEPEMELWRAPGSYEAAGERVIQEISRQAAELKHFQADTMAVSLRPDADTEIFLHLRQIDGVVEVNARFERGDFSELSRNWETIQQALSQQGVKLGTLQESSVGQGGPSWSGQDRDFREGQGEHQSERRRISNEIEDQVRLAGMATPKRSVASRSNSRAWESWA